MTSEQFANRNELLLLVTQRMPFGKYKDSPLCDLPVSYLEWFAKKGFPNGKLGNQLSLLHTIKTNGLDEILTNLRNINANSNRKL